MSALTDVGTGAVGAVLVAWFLAPFAADAQMRHVSTAEVMGALFGAVMFLALLKVVRGW